MSEKNRRAKYDLYKKNAPHRLSDALKAEFEKKDQTPADVAAEEAEAKKVAEKKLEEEEDLE